jgi:nicotinamide mononucleotide adenylyltransferase
MLLAGADLIQTISTPEVWDVRDVNHILGNFGVFVLERTGTDLETALGQLKRWEKNIHVIRQVSLQHPSPSAPRYGWFAKGPF